MSTGVSYPGVVPPPAGHVANIATPEDVLNTVNKATNIVCTLVITAVVSMRVYTKWRVLPPFGKDDWCCVITYILSLGHIATAFGMGAGGGGYNLWEVTPEQYKTFNKALYADTIIYGPNTWFLKVTLLLAITRVFNVKRRFVVFTYCFIGALAAYYLPVMFIKIRICWPIQAFWDPGVTGQCLNNRPIFVADTTMSAITDLAVLLLPIPLIMRLQMPWQKKLKVYVLLGAGGVATAASFIRMVLVVRMERSENPTVDFIRFNLPCTAEVTIGLVCACLPAINKFFAVKESEECNGHNHMFHDFGTNTPKFLKRMRPTPTLNGSKTKDLIFHSDLEGETMILRTDVSNTLTFISSRGPRHKRSKSADFGSSSERDSVPSTPSSSDTFPSLHRSRSLPVHRQRDGIQVVTTTNITYTNTERQPPFAYSLGDEEPHWSTMESEQIEHPPHGLTQSAQRLLQSSSTSTSS